MATLLNGLSRRCPAIVMLILVLALAGCQSISPPQSQVPSDRAETDKQAVDPAYSNHLDRIDRALSELNAQALPADEDGFVRWSEKLRAVGQDFLTLIQSGPATAPEYRLWGDFFNRLSDTVETVVAGDANLSEAEQLYELAARLYPLFLERSHLPERPFTAVDGETSAYYAGNYFLCTMPEMIADSYGRRGAKRMDQHLVQAMERYLEGPCEPDLMFSAAEMLYDYALASGSELPIYRERIEQADPAQSTPWLILLDNLSLADNRAQALANLDRALADARTNLDDGDEVSVEFASEVERQRTLLIDGQGTLRALPYRP